MVYPVVMKPQHRNGHIKSPSAFDGMVGTAVSRIWMELQENGVSPDCMGLIPALTFRLNQALQPLTHTRSQKAKAKVLSEAAQATRETLIALGMKMPMVNLDLCISDTFGGAKLKGQSKRARA